jgi:DNA-binding GntR family transcriptional regulator
MHSKVLPGTREQLLETFLRLAAVLQLTAQAAQARGMEEQHAALEACLAIFRARVEAGEAGSLLAESLARFGDEYKRFIEVELAWRAS